MKLPNSTVFSPLRLVQDITEWARKVALVHNLADDIIDDIYNGTRLIKGVDTTDDVIVNSDSKGIVLLDSAGHYWRISVTTAGALTTTDLGTSKP